MADILDVFGGFTEAVDFLTSHGEELSEGFGTIQQRMWDFRDRAGLAPSELLKAAEAHGNIAVPPCILASSGTSGSIGDVAISVLPKEPMPDDEFWETSEAVHTELTAAKT